MELSKDAQLYFWCRNTEGMPVERAVFKWNKGYPNEQVTPDQVEGYLATRLADAQTKVESSSTETVKVTSARRKW